MKNTPKIFTGLHILVVILSVGEYTQLAYGQSLSMQVHDKSARRPGSYTVEPCQKGEKWHFSSAIPMEMQKEMTAALFLERSATQSFAEAYYWRRVLEADEQKTLAEYWISRAMMDAGLLHSAHVGFNMILKKPTSATIAGIQAATLGCLASIYEQYPSMQDRLTAVDYQSIFGAVPLNVKHMVWRFALKEFMYSPSAETIAPLVGSESYETFAKAVLDIKENRYASAIKGFEKTLSEIAEKTSKQPGATASEIEKYKNKIYLLMSRAQYATKQYAAAAETLKKVSKQSNEITDAVTEMSWAYLLNGNYKEAIGSAYSITVGALANAYTPEATMVTAMAMNELCQYPHALDAIQSFKKSYLSSYQWLKVWSEQNSEKQSLYSALVDSLKKKKSDVPEKVLSEWMKLPVFMANQRELNLMVDEANQGTKAIRTASEEIKKEGELITMKAEDLLNQIKLYRSRQTTYQVGLETLPKPLQQEITDFRERVAHYRRYRAAAGPWKKITGHAVSQAAIKKQKLIGEVETALRAHSRRMLTQIQEIAENNQLIEVEIYNGASQDIIWQNAHPDYKEKAAQLEGKTDRAPASISLDWGRAATGSDGEVEVWEDEIGSFQAHLFDNCSNKEKYLAVGSQQ